MSEKKIQKKKVKRIRKLLYKGKIEEALKLANIEDIDDLIEIGTSFWEKNPGIAEKIFDRTTQLAPDDPRTWFHKGIFLAEIEKLEEAISCFDEVLKLNPGSVPAWCDKGLILVSLEKYEEALTCYDEALKIDPDFAVAWCNKGAALEALGRCDEELACYDKAVEANPLYGSMV